MMRDSRQLLEDDVGLELVGPTGRNGKLIISDERDDGTLLLLVCEEYGGRGGFVVRPGDEESPPDGGFFPWPTTAELQRQVAFGAAFTPPFEFTLNVEAMPPGLNTVSFDRLSSAVQEAIDSGVSEVTIRPENAEQWGWISSTSPFLR